MADKTDVAVPGAGRRELMVDLYGPRGESLTTALILLHGGGWRNGSRKAMAEYARALAAHGFFVVAAEYRLLGEAAWPAPLDDVKDVIRWVRAHAEEYGIDPQKIALEGFSAGGHLALLAAGTSDSAESRVAAVISLFAPAILERPRGPGPNALTMLLGPDADDRAIEAVNPIAHVRAGFPPTFLLGGMDDPLVPPAVTLRLFDALVRAECAVDLHLVHGHTHEFSALPSMLEPIQAEVALFLKRSVVDPARYRRENLEMNMFARPGGLPGA